MAKKNIDDLRPLLQQHAVRVTFTKQDGTTRVMFCTTNLDFIPEEAHPKGTGKEKADTLINVWDLVSQAWRSFHDHQVDDFERSTATADEIVETAHG